MDIYCECDNPQFEELDRGDFYCIYCDKLQHPEIWEQRAWDSIEAEATGN